MSKGLTKLFEGWRKKAEAGPFILLIDEIDSMGARGGAGHNESWFAPIVNAWLAFLDGAIPRDGIVVIGCTNYVDRVDEAMRRPGRLDMHIELPMPDIDAFAGIVKAHLGPDAMLTEDELAEAARAVRGRSPAEVQQLARESAPGGPVVRAPGLRFRPHGCCGLAAGRCGRVRGPVGRGA